ncbi:MAG: methyltransferase [Rhodospirillales bacterium]|nr:methyltransferase [Rhodospirillales bacterium]
MGKRANPLAEPTQDTILGGRVTIFQPKQGYRAAIDPVLLAAAVPVRAGEAVLDVGSGTGAASLALAARVDGVCVSGLEAQESLVALARTSARENGLEDRVAFIEGDLLTPPDTLLSGVFDHVMANPPYVAAGRGNPPPDPAKRAATVEGAAVLADWLVFLLSRLKDGGTVTLIHHFDRLGEVAEGLIQNGAGSLVIFPLWPKQKGRDAKRVIVQARKGGPKETRTADGLILHDADGDYTPAAEAILRGGRELMV